VYNASGPSGGIWGVIRVLPVRKTCFRVKIVKTITKMAATATVPHIFFYCHPGVMGRGPYYNLKHIRILRGTG